MPGEQAVVPVHTGPDTVGVPAGGLVGWRTGSVVACVAVAAMVTAVLRAV